MSWKSKSLGELCDSANGVIQTGPFGSQLKQSEYIDDKAGTPVVMPKDIKAGTVDESEIARISEAKANALSRHMLSAGDIVFPRRGEISKRAYIKEGSKYFCGTGCLKIHIPDADVLNKFLFYYLDQEHVVKWLEGRAIGSTMLNLNTSIMRSVQVKYPDIKTQEWIVNTLSAYDDLIENNKRRIALLEESARQLYKEWFVRFRFPGHEHVKIVDGVPEGWAKGCVADLGEVITGKTPSTKVDENYGGDIPFVKTPDMHGPCIVVSTEQSLTDRGAKTQPKKLIPANSIMVSCIGTIGVTAINAFPSHTNQQINSVLPRETVLRYFSYLAISALKPRMEAMGGGATMANVNKAKFSRLPVLIPNKLLLEGFHESVNKSFEQITILLNMNTKLIKARDLFLPKLMSGELTV